MHKYRQHYTRQDKRLIAEIVLDFGLVVAIAVGLAYVAVEWWFA